MFVRGEGGAKHLAKSQIDGVLDSNDSNAAVYEPALVRCVLFVRNPLPADRVRDDDVRRSESRRRVRREAPENGGRAAGARLYPRVEDDVRGRVPRLALAGAPQSREVTEESRFAVVVLVRSRDDVVDVALIDGRVEWLFALHPRFPREEVYPTNARKGIGLRQNKDSEFGVALISLPEEFRDHGVLDEFYEVGRLAVCGVVIRCCTCVKERFVAGQHR